MKMISRTASLGVLGTIGIVLVLLACLNFDKLPLIRNNHVITAEFAEAAGLKGGDEVRVSGAMVGRVTGVRLDHGVVKAELALNHGVPRLGDRTRAAIVTVTLLGRMAVQLTPEGTGDMKAGEVIPLERSSAPYDLNSDLKGLTDKTTSIDKQSLSSALDQVTAAFANTPGDINQALTGVEKLSRSVGENDNALESLLARAKNVTGTLAAHNAELTDLLTTGSALLAQLDARQQVVVSLLHSAQGLADQLRAVIHENGQAVGPALTELDRVIDVLNRNRANLQATITGVRNYATAFNEAISTGPFFDAYIQNLTSPGTLAPVLSKALQ